MILQPDAPPLIVYAGPEDALDAARDAVAAAARVEQAAPTPEAVSAALTRAVAFLDASMKVRVTSAMIGDAPSLRVVATATTGADHIDAAALAARGIPLLTLRGETEVLRELTPAAEHSWLLVLACARQLRPAIAHVLDGHWDRTRFPGLMLRGRTIGLVGCGRIGQHMGTYARAFGMRAIGFDPHVAPWPEHIERIDLDALLAAADVVSVHVPFGDATRHLLDRRRVALMKPGAVLVNTSRGEIVDEAAVADAVRGRRLGALGVDVLSGEPDTADHPIVALARTHPNVVITPHIGGFCPDAVRIVVRHAARRILRALELPHA